MENYDFSEFRHVGVISSNYSTLKLRYNIYSSGFFGNEPHRSNHIDILTVGLHDYRVFWMQLRRPGQLETLTDIKKVVQIENDHGATFF